MKKTVSILTAIIIVAVMASVCLISASAKYYNLDGFTPNQYTANKAPAGSITLDASATVDAGYTSSPIKLEGKLDITSASCTANVAYDDEYIYLHILVNDTTYSVNNGASDHYYDSIELYFDFDNNKEQNNLLDNDDLFAGQFRIQRGGSKIHRAYCGSDEKMNELVGKSSVALTELGEAVGYVVEIQFAHDGLALSDKIGFAIQVNDSNNGFREGQLFTNTNTELQRHTWQYTSVYDTLTLNGFTPTTTRAAAVGKNDIPASSSEQAPVSSLAPPITSVEPMFESIVEPAPEEDNQSEPIEDEDAAAEADMPISIGALIAIVAGGVVLLAGAAVVIILVLKKKTAVGGAVEAAAAVEPVAAQADATEADEKTE